MTTTNTTEPTIDLTKDHPWERTCGNYCIAYRILDLGDGLTSSYLFILGPGLDTGLSPVDALAAVDHMISSDQSAALKLFSNLTYVWSIGDGEIGTYIDTAMKTLWTADEIYKAGKVNAQLAMRTALGFNG